MTKERATLQGGVRFDLLRLQLTCRARSSLATCPRAWRFLCKNCRRRGNSMICWECEGSKHCISTPYMEANSVFMQAQAMANERRRERVVVSASLLLGKEISYWSAPIRSITLSLGGLKEREWSYEVRGPPFSIICRVPHFCCQEAQPPKARGHAYWAATQILICCIALSSGIT